MFEKRPIWGIIVGLNVCVLIWLISVQEPVLYDASTAIISSSLQQQQHQQQQLQQQLSKSNNGGTWAAIPAALGERDDRDFRKRHQPSTDYNLLSSAAAAVSSNNNNNASSTNAAAKITTDATTALAASNHVLTSSLGTGIRAPHARPTPSWLTLTAVSSALPPEDFTLLIDLQQFHYIVPQPVCSSEIKALILVHSAPRNREKRQLIRDTWGSIVHHTVDASLRILFLLGAVDDEQLQQRLLQENNRYADIIQGSFQDDYRNMTYKHVMAFKWFLYNCPQAQILLKVDDDVYVNTPQLLQYLKKEREQELSRPPNYVNPTHINSANTTPDIASVSDSATATATFESVSQSKSLFLDTLRYLSNSLVQQPSDSMPDTAQSEQVYNGSLEFFHQPQNLLFCQKITGSLVKRSYRSKWRVGFKEYSGRYYPPYCPGYAIIYSPDVIFRLYTAAQKSKYFWIDDVHITGVLAQQTNTSITTSSHYILYSDECDRLLTGKTDLKDMEFLFAWHSISAPQIRALWHLQMMAEGSGKSATSEAGGAAVAPTELAAIAANKLAHISSKNFTAEGFR